MSASTSFLVCDNSTLANFKTWGQAISNAFSAAGWTQTTDTGQVNWSTIVAVPSSTYVYEVWKTSDALSSTLPIFNKVWYGFSSTSPRFEITTGTGSDGSGNITGQVITSAPWLVSNSNTNQGATTFACYFSGSTGEMRVSMWNTATSTIPPCFFIIERSKDASGNNTADYFTVISCPSFAGTSGCFQQTVTATGVTLRDTGIVAVGGDTGAGTGLNFGTVAAFPTFPILGKVGNPMLGLMTAYAADITNGATVTVASMYGSTHTYVALNPGGSFSLYCGQRSNVGATMAPLMRYE